MALAEDGRRQDLFWFYFVLLLAGLVSIYFFFVRPILATENQDGWVKTVCIIESSQLKRSSEGTNTAYAVEVFYRYAYAGRDHRFSHTHSLGESAGERKARRALNRRFPPGEQTVCYVNPRNPVEAVLERRSTKDASANWIALCALGLVAAALFGMFCQGAIARPAATATAPGRPQRSLRYGRALSNNAKPSEMVPQEFGEDSLEFKPARAPWERTAIVMLVALVFNGVVAAILLSLAGDGWLSVVRTEDWLPTILCLAVAVFIGLGLLGLCGYFFLALFNPRPWFRVNTRTLTPGGTLEVEWRILGHPERLQRLKFFLEAVEVATFIRGTDQRTDRLFLDRVTIVEATDTDQIRTGRASRMIPTHLVPSFASEHNQIEWSIRVHGEIRRWPDLQEGMPVVLLPFQPGSAAGPAATPNRSSAT